MNPRRASHPISRASLGAGCGVPVELVTYPAAGKVFDATKTGEWDVSFVAIEPVRAAEIEFSAPYVIIEGTYMVPKDLASESNRRR